jgi:hypothetical protein
MGRHAVPDETPRPATPAPTGRPLLARAVLATTAAVTTLLVTTWAGTPLPVAGVAALGAAVIVCVAAWIAGTMPSPRRPDDGPHDPVQ